MGFGSKIELIHWRTCSQRTPHATAPIELDTHLFNPQRVVRWLGYWMTTVLTATHHYRHRPSLVQAAFSFVKTLSSPSGGVTPFLCHHLGQGLLLPILTYGADLYTSNSGRLWGSNNLWHRVQGWTTNAFFSTPTSMLSRAACHHPIIAYHGYTRRLAAIRVARASSTNDPTSARLPASLASLSCFRAREPSPHLTTGLSAVYLPPYWRTPVPSPPIRKHLTIDALAHLTRPIQ